MLDNAKNIFKLSTMVGENFEIYMPQIAKTGHRLSTMVGENFEIYMTQIAKTDLSTMVGDNFEIYIYASSSQNWSQSPWRIFLPVSNTINILKTTCPAKKFSLLVFIYLLML